MQTMTTKHIANLSRDLLGKPHEELCPKEQHVIESLASGAPIATNVDQVFIDQTSLCQTLADSLAKMVGSWPFIISFMVFLFVWMGFNTFVLSSQSLEFDPYPYILLNLVLSTVASIQAPVIMMSQNRQNERDRISSSNAFEVGLKTELAIQQLHEKVDLLLGQGSDSST